jgi:hypothetical protein
LSLLAELIAQLHALLDQNRQTQALLQAAEEQAEATLGQVRAATEGSSSPLVPEGLGQVQQGMDRLQEAQALMAAGGTALEQYIDLLQGGGAASAGGGGAKPPAQPPRPAAPEPEPSDDGPSTTRPTLPPAPDRVPDGPPEKPDGEARKVRGIERQNAAAALLARLGYQVRQSPPPRANKRRPDFLIEGKWWDCYAPTSGNVRNIRSSIRDKVSKEQADRIVLDLSDSTVGPEALRTQLARDPVRGLKEIKIIKDSTVIDFYPWAEED